LGPLVDGGARENISKFALTSNNITYAAMGDAMQYWQFYPVTVIDDGDTAFLTQRGKRLVIGFAGEGVPFDILDVSAPKHDYDAPNPKVRQLTVTAKLRG